MYDVIVIGAGPAGCTAAKTLAESGRHVLLLEKFRLPRYKSCSGVLIKKSMDLIERYFCEKVPERVMCLPYENHGMIFTDDHGREYRFEQPGLNVWRSDLDFWLAEKAVKSGAELRDGAAVLSCAESDGCVFVTVSSGAVEQASYVIDCEGVVGLVKRRLTGETPDLITTYQTFSHGCADLDPHYFYAYLQPELSEYDAWYNVKDNMPVLGVSVKDNSRISYFYEKFITYMTEKFGLRLTKRVKEEKWLMPRILPGCPVNHGAGRVLFAGETAGFLNPMGEGISAGMESGYLAACAVDRNFGDIDGIYSAYRLGTAELESYMRRQWTFVGRMTDTFREMR